MLSVFKKKFESFQIEPTSGCFLRCVMCPRIALLQRWKNLEMPFEGFQKIGEYFPYARHVHLQGWGEPLLHPRIYDMLRLAKDAGCSAGFTTNAMLLSRQAAQKLVESEIDIIGISIAGSSRQVHEGIRVASDFERFVQNIRTLTELKKERGAEKPKVVLSFLMTRSNIRELPGVVELASKLHADELTATNLDYTPYPQQDSLKVFSCAEINPEFGSILEKAIKRAEESDLVFRPYPLKTDEVLVCELNPLRNIYISADGFVAPCVYLNPTLDGAIPRIFCGREQNIERTAFGNALQEDLLQIWSREEYRNFREKLEKRLEFQRSVLGQVTFELDGIEKLKEGLEKLGEKAPLPQECATCYKAYGI